jgi:DNA mismatch repair protein MSH6
MLRKMLPSSTLWQSFRDNREFYSSDETLRRLSEIFETTDDDGTVAKMPLPEAIEAMLGTPIAMEALGGMLFYLNSLNLDKDLISQKNFNIYDPLKEGKNLVLDGVTLGHMEVSCFPRGEHQADNQVLVNNEGGTDGTLLELLQLCQTPSGKFHEPTRSSRLRKRKAVVQNLALFASARPHGDQRKVSTRDQLSKRTEQLDWMLWRT